MCRLASAVQNDLPDLVFFPERRAEMLQRSSKGGVVVVVVVLVVVAAVAEIEADCLQCWRRCRLGLLRESESGGIEQLRIAVSGV